MFIRQKKAPKGSTKIQLVESIRQGNRVRQKVVRHIGTARNEQEYKQVMKMAEYAKAMLENESHPSLFSPEEVAEMSLAIKEKQAKSEKVHVEDLQEESRHVLGIHDVYGTLYDMLGFGRALANPKRQQKDADYLRHLVVARIANPSSKKKTVELLEKSFGVSLELDRVYRVMDKVDDERVEAIQKLGWQGTQQTLNLFDQKVDVAFYDLTTLYFESFEEDELKQNGYSKDGKFNQAQVVLGLCVTQEGLPVGYEVFPGSSYEGHTVMKMLEQLKKRFELGKVIFVADSGLLSEKNIKQLEEANYEYVVGARLKALTQDLQRQVTDEAGFEKLGGEVKVKELQVGNKRLIVSHSEKRGRKDQHDRKKALEKLKKKLKSSKKPESLISNYGYKKYLKIMGETKVVLDEEKMREEEKWDGLHGVISNAKKLTKEEILEQYKGLWQVEETFRISKHDMKIRPIFHWKPSRVRAHIAICYMALCCVRNLECRVKNQYQKLSPEVIRENLLSVQASKLVHKPSSKRYLMPSVVGEHAEKLYQVMALKLGRQPIQI